MLTKILTAIACTSSIGFGAWHFFVPSIWRWYDYIAPDAAELVIAVRAINVFFSLCLVLIGAGSAVIVFASRERLARIVILSIATLLWAARVVLQLVYPQGSASPPLQYGMLAAFIVTFICCAVPLGLAIFARSDKIGATH